ncbi:hypothetical protein ACFO4E_20980 [Nocardiopsis mangrovi]|uniref:DoxX family membrane protein n=1 Tax=Nocardiopsis mangrovi TaxID=1179818 RepID=A0ABV9DZN7_9ACTN
MKRCVRTRHLPVRIATGAFILGTGLDKKAADDEAAQQLHGFAASAYPVVNKVDPRTFTRLVAAGEITLGTALLLPVVPTLLAGVGLTAFSAGLLGLYLRIPGMRREGSLLPTEQGLSVAQDVWLLGAGLSLVVDAVTDRGR